MQNANSPLNEIDLTAAGLCAFFIVFEAVADQQQWAFQVWGVGSAGAERQRLMWLPSSC